MERHKNITILSLLTIGTIALAGLQFCLAGQSGTNKPASVLLQEALYAEEIEGDVDAAIKIYEQIINDKSAQRSHVAQAMYREGMCYIKQQKDQKAQEIFRTLVAQYSEQTEITSKVKPLLEDLGNADPASLMPPETLFYAEIGSPGRQVEAILKMLKGTPLENPLAAIGNGQNFNSQAAMISALLNPSMMAEFKKIRGMGIGLTGIPHKEEPPAIIVLFPGKSDALKGLLQMVLGMAGKPTESIEGMQTLSLPEGGCAVYDDTVVILATPKACKAGQLAWSVKQYKGIINEPTLASSNKSFTQISKKTRQENLLTVWVDADKFFAKIKEVLPDDQIPQQFHIADGMVNFSNINDIISFVRLQETGIAAETNISFKDGQQSLAYNMIRTPNLKKSGFEAVPSNAIGLISFALGQADSPQAQAIGQKIQNETGLDIVGEIFANVEQVALFIMPESDSSNQTNTQIPPAVTSIGLAITSHNPQQTRQALMHILSSAELLADNTGEQPSEQTTGEYQIELADGQKLFCYMDQDREINVISLSPEVIKDSISALKNKKSVLTAGPLQEQIGKTSPYTSKLILINIGGFLKIVESSVGPMPNQDNIKEILSQLAANCDKTFYQLRTEEKPNNINIRAEVSGIPPANDLFLPLMQLAQIIESAQKQLAEKQAPKTATVIKTDRSPVIDGSEEDIWSDAPKYKLENVIYSPVSSDEDCRAYYKVMWDKENLYLLVDVTDDELINDSTEFYYDDNIELFIDADNSRNGEYGDNDYTFDFNWDRTAPNMEARGQQYENDDIKYALVTSENGYRLEIKFPWSTLGTNPSPGSSIGLDVHVNDDDDGEERDTKLTWSDTRDDAWQNPASFGTVGLAGLVGWWKLDETGGSIAKNSSSNSNDGKLADNASWQPNAGKSGGAVKFDDPASNVLIPMDGMLACSGTVTLWAKLSPEQQSPEHRYFFGHTTEPHYSNRIQIYMDGGTTMLNVGLGDKHETNTDMATLEVNKWYHIALSWENGTYKVYLDGAPLESGNYTGLKNISATANIGNNGRTDSRDQSFNGLIDDVRIYNYALSADEIKALY